ncbi:hypothetical protein GGQ84_002043 [Desulfitispora alkaliphila]|uniref:hypothetical protein n=1 Tax=Desulfitispora alkaliphila TaxID=622674 RepID=UPI003D24DE14
MLTLLEKLPSEFEKKFKDYIKMTELTKVSLLLNTNAALVITNKQILIAKKKFLLGIRVTELPQEDLLDLLYNEDTYELVFKTKEKDIAITVDNAHVAILEKLKMLKEISLKRRN